jgi:hypothetical protein
LLEVGEPMASSFDTSSCCLLGYKWAYEGAGADRR